MAKKKITIEAKTVAAPTTPRPAPPPEPKTDHTHQYVLVGALREGEFMKQCPICADMRRVEP